MRTWPPACTISAGGITTPATSSRRRNFIAAPLVLRTRRLRQTFAPAERREAELAVAECQFNLGFTLALTGEPEAEAFFRACLATRQKLLPPQHLDVAMAKAGLAALLLDLGRAGEAAKLGLEAMQVVFQTEGVDAKSVFAAVLYFPQGMISRMLKRYPAAEKSLRKAWKLPVANSDCAIRTTASFCTRWATCWRSRASTPLPRSSGGNVWRSPVRRWGWSIRGADPDSQSGGVAVSPEPVGGGSGAVLPGDAGRSEDPLWRQLSVAMQVAARCGRLRGSSRCDSPRSGIDASSLGPACRRGGPQGETLALLNAVGRSFVQAACTRMPDRLCARPCVRLATARTFSPRGCDRRWRSISDKRSGRRDVRKGPRSCFAPRWPARQARSGPGRLAARSPLAGWRPDRPGPNAEAAALFEAKSAAGEQAADCYARGLLHRAAKNTEGCRQAVECLRKEPSLAAQVNSVRLRALATNKTEEKELAAAIASLKGIVKRTPASHAGRQTLAWCLLRAGKVADAEPHLKALATLPGGKDNPFDDLLRTWAARRKEPTAATTAALAKVLAGLEALPRGLLLPRAANGLSAAGR